jgi:hydrogenase maturation factor
MHDPTEGGVVGAAWEMAEASGCGFRLHIDRILVRPTTRLICEALGVDPLRLIASGALLIACHDGAAMLRGLTEGGIQAAVIGEFALGERQLIHPDGRVERLDGLARDEIYRILESNA